MIGATISHYKILEKLGEGGMGVVYKAHDTKLDRNVALKYLPLDLTRDPDAKGRFIHEAKVVSALDHPNICTIHGIDDTEDGRSFIVMPYYEGQSLKEKIAHSPMKVKDAINNAIQIAQGLQKAHEKHIVHSDIKPANIIITSEGVVKILDFGLAKFFDAKHISKTRKTIGTAAYMSPEQVRGEKYDHRSDIWSLGVCLFEMITGEIPFDGDYEQALMYAIINDCTPSINYLQNDRGTKCENIEIGRIEQIIHKCLEKRAQDRYQTIEEFLIDLKGLLHTSQTLPVKDIKNWRSLKNIRQLYWVVSVLVVFGIIFALSKKYFLKDYEDRRKSIAILPFKNLNANKDDEYFSDGITEDVINKVSKIGELIVVSRTSSMRYKNSNMSIREIGRELNVDVILEGSVRRSYESIRIVSQLIDVNTDTHIWSETYDRPFRDVFEIQSDVARSIARAMKITIGADSAKIIEQKPLGEITAYDYYLKGREYYYRFRKGDNEKAIIFFKKAIDLEPNYTIALAGIADAYSQRVAKFGFSPNWIDSALDISNKVISIDPDLSEAHKALGLAYSGKGIHRKAIQYYLKSIELNPNYLTAIGNIGAEYSFLGEYDKALMWFKKAVPLNPTFPYSYYTVGGTYLNLDNYEKANEWFNKCLQIEPDFQFVHAGLGMMYLRQGDHKQSYTEAMKILSIDPDDLEGLTLAGWSKIFAGEYKEAKEMFEKSISIDSIGTFWYGCGRSSYTALGFIHLKIGEQPKAYNFLNLSRKFDQTQLKQKSEWYTIRYDLALISALEGKNAEAYQWLREAVDLGWRDYHLGKRDPLLETLQGDEEFKEIINKVQSHIQEMRKRADE